MRKQKNIDTIDTNKSEKVKVRTTIPSAHKAGLAYYDDIRMSWISNQKHCEPNNKRGYFERGITFCDEWQGELGWMRYYIFHRDAGYVKGKSKLIRIDDNKGFSPSNCIIKDKVVNKPKEVTTKPKTRKTKSESQIDIMTPANVINHIMVFADGMKPQDIIELLKSVGSQHIDEEHNKIIYLETAENQSIKQKNAKN